MLWVSTPLILNYNPHTPYVPGKVNRTLWLVEVEVVNVNVLSLTGTVSN